MTIGMHLSQSHSLGQTQRFTQEQQTRISLRQLEIRLSFLRMLHGEDCKPHAVCPQCSRNMNSLEIMRGFRTDPNDYATECANCHHRFEAKLLARDSVSRMELPFFCSDQTLAQLRGKEQAPPEEFRRKNPALYYSARIHHGGLRQAFEKIDIQYAYEEIPHWEDKATSFLGVLPDTMIAMCVDKPVRAVRNLRNRLGISAARKRDWADE